MSMKLYKEQNVQNIADAIRDRIGYEGKNLIPSFESVNKNGVNVNKNNDGSITLNGTATGEIILQSSIISLESGVYTLSSKNQIPHSSWLSISNQEPILNGNITSITKEISKTDNAYLYYYIAKGVVFNNLTIYPQLEEGTQATSYESYDLKYKIRDMAAAIRELPSRIAYEKLLQNQVFETATGNPVYLENSADMPFKKLEVQGNTEQESYSGKNLLKNTLTSQILSGIELTINNDKSITMKGTATARIEPRLWSNTGLILKANTTYYNFSGTTLYFYSSSYKAIQPNGTYIPTEDENVSYFYIRVENGEVINKTIYPMLTTINNSTYEPYVGGTASPNPEYPQEVKCVGQDVNLFDKNNVTIEKGAISAEGNFTDSNTRIRVYNVFLKENETFTIKSKNTNLNVVTYYYDKDNRFISYDSGWKTMPYTFKTPANTSILKILFKMPTDTISLGDILDIQIKQGTTATPYTPYGQGSASVKVQNRNLFNPVPVYINYNVNSDGFGPSTNYATTGKIKVGNATKINYGLISGFTNVGDNGLRMGFFKKDGTFISRNNLIPTTSIKEEQIPNNTDYIMIGAFNSVNNGLWLEANKVFIGFDNDTSVIEHQEQNFTIPVQQEMCAIGDVKDRFTKIGGKWFEEHNVGTLEINGTETWSIDTWFTSTDNSTHFKTSRITKPEYADTTEIINNSLSNNFKYRHGREQNNNEFYLNLPSKYLLISVNTISTIEEFKAWLSQHNTIIYCALQTPVLIECTEEQSQILNKLQEALTYQGGTHVSATSENANPILDIEYFLDMTTAFLNAEPEL